MHDTRPWCIRLERRGGVVELLTRANISGLWSVYDVKSSSFEVFAEYMARSSWLMVMYDFWALSSFREKKASGFQLLSTAQVRCVNGDASGASGTGVVE